jgi:peptidoglycan-associated lipoprotein
MKPTLSHLIPAVFLVFGACAHQAATKPPADVTGQSSGVGPSAATHPPNGDRLIVSDEIARACNIHIDNPADAPKFDFDSSDLSTQDRDVLNQVAKCAIEGPLKGMSLKLVGRADPRGEEEYNMVLGGSRAASVRMYLSRLGVDGSRLVTTSRGKLDANGTSEDGWRLDRRVDIEVERGGSTNAKHGG